ncbi:hypothetical protein DMN50_06875 [Priestia megaterium]|nr:hypothetical protein DMN50_06875 [Priestia megaterium]
MACGESCMIIVCFAV